MTYAIFSGLCGFAESPLQLAVLRFIAALGMGGEWSLGVALVMEIWPSKSRPMLAGLIGAASNVGFLLIALVGLVMAQFIGAAADGLRAIGLSEEWVAKLIGADNSGWRLLMFVGATPALLTFFVRMFVPESERWQHASPAAPPARVARYFSARHAAQNDPGHVPGRHGADGHVGLDPMDAALGQQDGSRHRRAQTAAAYTQICSAIGAIIGTLAGRLLGRMVQPPLGLFRAVPRLSLVVCGYLFRAPMRVRRHVPVAGSAWPAA